MAEISGAPVAPYNSTESSHLSSLGSTSDFHSGGGPLFVNSVVTGNTLIWHSNGPQPQTLFDWFSNIKYWLHHENMCKNLHSNTGTWLLEREEFLTWKAATDSSVLWLHGIPGCGKSKLVAHVINHMKASIDASTSSFAYFYCLRDVAEDERSRPEEAIRCILRQISFTSGNPKVLKQAAADFYQIQKEKAMEHGSEKVEGLTPQQSISLLITLLEGSSTIIIIDAIDELKDEERWKLFEAFNNILEAIGSGSVRLFVSSRDNGEIKMALSKYTNVYIKATDNQDDIQRFVNVEIDRAISNHRLLRGAVPPWLKTEIVTTLVKGAQGMFRWVSLQIQALCSPNMKSTKSIKKALKGLPKTLAESYDVVYEQILDLDPDARMMAQNAVRWLLCAKRPLQSSELLAALSTSDVEVASPLPDQESQLDNEELLDSCCNLIVLDESVDTFRMAHLSVREYFENKTGFDKVENNVLALGSCIDTLMDLTIYDRGCSGFVSYATMYWPEHCQEIGPDGPQGPLREKMKIFMFKDREAISFFERWASMTKREFHRWSGLRKAQQRKLLDSATLPATPQFVASSYGLPWVLKEMVNSKSFDHDRRIDCGDTGFSLAAIWGYVLIAEEFLRAGADVNVPGNDGRTPLIIAVEHGHQDLVRLLLTKGANINAQWLQGRTPLHEAVYWGQNAIAKILLDSGADIAKCDRHDVTPLITAVQRDHAFVPGVFYDGDASIDPENKDSSTGLFYSGDMMRLLLNHGADACNLANKTALSEAVKASNTSAVKILIERGVDVNFANSGQERPLDIAIGGGLSDTIGNLISHGAIPGLKWDKESYQIRQWMKESWYPQLLSAMNLGEGRTAAPFISMPESTETRVCREEALVVTEGSPDIPYLWIRIPSNMTSVNCIKFTTISHDQGWSDNAARLRGTYEQSFTWFEVGCASSTRHFLPRHRFQHNIHASTKYHTHVKIWTTQDSNPEVREFLATLQSGDSVQVFAKACFPGWANYVKSVEIEIYGIATNRGEPTIKR